MHHVIVTRVSISLSVLLAALAVGFAVLVTPGAGPAVAGEGGDTAGGELFDKHCGACHEASELSAAMAGADDPAALEEQWLRLLENHGQSTADQDRVILEYLGERD